MIMSQQYIHCYPTKGPAKDQFTLVYPEDKGYNLHMFEELMSLCSSRPFPELSSLR